MSTRKERRKTTLGLRREQKPGRKGSIERWRGTAIWGIAAAVAIGVVVFLFSQQEERVSPELDDRASLAGTYYPSLGNLHLQPGQDFQSYNSHPPTSGPHDPFPVNWGIYDVPQSQEMLVHSMEHGGVIIWYDCPMSGRDFRTGSSGEEYDPECEGVVRDLERIAQEYLDLGRRVVLAPISGIGDFQIALTAWTRLEKMADFDAARIHQFVESHDGRYNPERIPLHLPGS